MSVVAAEGAGGFAETDPSAWFKHRTPHIFAGGLQVMQPGIGANIVNGDFPMSQGHLFGMAPKACQEIAVLGFEVEQPCGFAIVAIEEIELR